MRVQLIACTIAAIALVAVLLITRPEVLQRPMSDSVSDWVDPDTGCRYWRRTGGPIMRSDGLADCGQPRKAVSP